MHPGSRILIYVLSALVIPGLSFFMLAILSCAALVVILLLKRQPLRLIWRTRWLLLVLLLGYGFSVPGESVWTPLGTWAPTWSGLALGLGHAAHLVVLLLWLDVLVLSLSAERVLGGLHGLMTPLAFLGVDTRRIALRLALTLKAIESLELGGARSLGAALGRGRSAPHRLFDPEPDPCLPDHIALHRYPLRVRDVLIPVLLWVGATAGWLSAWPAVGGFP